MLRWTTRILLAALLALVLFTFVVCATVAESALHPPFRRRASDTAALAVSTSHSVGGEARQVTLRAADNVMLKAWWIQPANWNGKVVVVCHGVADSGFGMMGAALLFSRNGYASLVPDSRGHGESGGFVTYGVYESKDILQWLNWIQTQQHPKSIFGFGESLGGAILLESLSRGAPFQAVIAESSYAHFKQVAWERVVKYGRVPGWLANVFLQEALLYVRLRHGVDLREADPASAVAHTSVPILLIHGDEDRETYPVHSQEIFAAAKCAELWRVPGAGHTGAYATAPRLFEQRVLSFYQTTKIN